MRTIRLQVNAGLFVGLLLMVIAFGLTPALTLAQTVPTPVPEEPPSAAPSRLEVQPVARDDEIQARLQDILAATGWFTEPQVRVQDGVVFLTGQAQSAEHKAWAGDLARNTQDVAAVVNQLEVVEPEYLDFQPFVTELQNQGRIVLRSIPLLGFSLVILFFAWLIARFVTGISRGYLHRREANTLLQTVVSRTIGVLVFLGGLYLVFQVAGLTNIAFTIIGGTGLLGLVLGIAFRDITENFLASIFLSVQNPFSAGDLVEINNVTGFVQRMTTRTTILMTPAGNHVQIPNATVYTSIIHNYTSNPNRRIDFTVGIGYDDSISLAQETIRQVLEEHPAILDEPEHLVLVDSLGSATVNLLVFCWIDGTQFSYVKVKSSVIRLVKRALEDTGISMPDEAREVIFPQGVPVLSDGTAPAPAESPRTAEPATVVSSTEGGLNSEAEAIQTQADQSRMPEDSENLLKS
jgi:small conductance mechanosensitive channel